MKNKFFIISSVLQIIFSLLGIIQDVSLTAYGLITIILCIPIIKNTQNGTLTNKKVRTLLTQMAIIFFLAPTDINFYTAIITTVVLLFTKSPNKQKTKLPKCVYEVMTTKRIFAGMVILLMYISQHFFINFIPTNISYIVAMLFNITLFILLVSLFKSELNDNIKVFIKNFKTYFKFIMPKYGLTYLFIIIVNVILVALIGQFSTPVNQATSLTTPIWYLIPTSIILAPIIEELLFRGVLRNLVKNKVAFILLSALTFWFMHVFKETSLTNMITNGHTYFTLGVLFAYLYSKTNNLSTNIFTHMLQNTIGTIMLLLNFTL